MHRYPHVGSMFLGRKLGCDPYGDSSRAYATKTIDTARLEARKVVPSFGDRHPISRLVVVIELAST